MLLSINMALLPFLIFVLCILTEIKARDVPVVADIKSIQDLEVLKDSTRESLVARLEALPPVPPPQPDYEYWNLFDFHNFQNAPPRPNLPNGEAYKFLVLRTMVQITDILRHTRSTLTEQQIKVTTGQSVDQPSLLRYGPTNSAIPPSEWLATMNNVVDRLLVALGDPPYHNPALRQSCYPWMGKLQIYYQTDPYSPDECSSNENIAYHFVTPDLVHDGITFCQLFFEQYRDLTQLNPSEFSPYFETGKGSSAKEPTFFSASDVLHELLHYGRLYQDVFRMPDGTSPIDDQRIRNPADPSGKIVDAYGAYAARMVKEWDWINPDTEQVIPPGGRYALYNDDNWAYFMLESYLQQKYNLPNWQDSPAPS